LLPVLMSSCKKEQERVKEWTDITSISLRLMPPVCAVWYRPGSLGWLPNKCFAQGDEIREIIRLLRDEKESEIPNPMFKGTQKLSLIFYKGSPETLTVRELSFDLNNCTFIWAFGKSEKLGKLFTEKEVWGSYHTSPYDPNFIKRAKESQEYLQKEIKKRMAEKEAGAQKKLEK
jgi:hypothetical protein